MCGGTRRTREIGNSFVYMHITYNTHISAILFRYTFGVGLARRFGMRSRLGVFGWARAARPGGDIWDMREGNRYIGDRFWEVWLSWFGIYIS